MSGGAFGFVERYSPYGAKTYADGTPVPTEWASKRSVYALHLALADIANDVHGNRIWLTQSALARKARLRRQTVNEGLAQLVDDGYLKRIGDHSRTGKPICFQLLEPKDLPIVWDPNFRVGDLERAVTAADNPLSSERTGPVTTADTPVVTSGDTFFTTADTLLSAQTTGVSAEPTPITKENSSRNSSGTQLADAVGEEKGQQFLQRAELHDALITVTGHKPVTDRERSGVGRCVKELLAVTATAADIRARAATYRSRYPNAVLTAHALVRHWGELGPAVTPPATTSDVDELLERDEQARAASTPPPWQELGLTHREYLDSLAPSAVST